MRLRLLRYGAIVSSATVVLALDLLALPADARLDIAFHPMMPALLAALVVFAGVVCLQPSAREIVQAAIAYTLVVFTGPIVLALQSVDVTSAIVARRVGVSLIAWMGFVVVIHRQVLAAAIDRARADLQRKVEERTHELQQTSEALRQAKSRLDALMEVSFDGVVVTEGGIIREVSSASAARLGYQPDEVIGVHVQELLVSAFHARALRMSAMPRTPGPIELALKHRDGSTVYVEYVATDVKAGDRDLRVIGLRNIERRLALEREIVAIGERERTRIGYDLHDHVGQVLVSARWAAQRLSRRMQEGTTEAREASQLVRLVEQAMNETRRVSSRLAPQVLDTKEIYPALRLLSADVNRHTDLSCTLRCARHVSVPEDEATIHLYRIAEEGVSNALKHGNAQHIELSFGVHGDSYVLEVLDDGVGIPDECERRDGVGVRSIRYRARLLQGTADIERRAEGGTRLVCAFPT